MNILLIVLLLSPLSAGATRIEVKEAVESVKSLIAPLLPGKNKKRPSGTENFRVDACERHDINWRDVLLLRSRPTLSFDFKEGCDIKGTVEPRVLTPFPAELELRNLRSYNRLETMNKVTSTIESKPIMNLNMTDGVLHGKLGKVRFEADYQVQLDPMNREKPVEKNLGGELRITEIFGLKVSIREKIMVE